MKNLTKTQKLIVVLLPIITTITLMVFVGISWYHKSDEYTIVDFFASLVVHGGIGVLFGYTAYLFFFYINNSKK